MYPKYPDNLFFRLRRNSVLLDIVHDLLDVLHEETETRLLRAKAAVKNKEMKIAHLFPKLFKEIKKPLLTNDIN